MFLFFFSSRRRHTRLTCDWSSDVCSSDLEPQRQLDPDPVHDQAHDVGGQLLWLATARQRVAAGPGIEQVEQCLRGERRVHLPQLAGLDAVIEDLLEWREEVP